MNRSIMIAMALATGGACRGAPATDGSKETKEPSVTTRDDGGGVDAVATGTVSPSDGVDRRARLRALIAAGSPAAADALVKAASDPDPLVRSEVAYQLVRTHHPQALALLEHLTGDPAPVVRVMTVEALAELGGADAHRRMLDLVGDPSEDVRGALVRALEGVEGGDAEAALERLARDPVVTVRDRAAAILATRRHGP